MINFFVSGIFDFQPVDSNRSNVGLYITKTINFSINTFHRKLMLQIAAICTVETSQVLLEDASQFNSFEFIDCVFRNISPRHPRHMIVLTFAISRASI